MDGILSQDEINALLSGMDLSDQGEHSEEKSESTLEELNDVEKDAIGEIANISMGTSATTLYSLVNRKVEITTPVVSLTQWDKLISEYDKPCVCIQIKYMSGLDGSNILILKEQDVKIITDLMMGGDGTNIEGELTDLHLSAISEAMNQMMGSSATSLSSMLGKKIDISPPIATLVDVDELVDMSKLEKFLDDTFVRIAFRMTVGDLVDSTILQLYPVDFAKEICESFKIQQLEEMGMPAPTNMIKPKAPEVMPNTTSTENNGMDNLSNDLMGNQNGSMGMQDMGMGQMPPVQDMGTTDMGLNQMPNMGIPNMQNMGMNGMNMGMNGMNMGMNMNMGMPMFQQPQMANINVQPAQFQSFAPQAIPPAAKENIGLIMDVPLEVTVELGRTTKSISDILDFAPGTIIELDKIAGEPIDVLVNGKFVAKGEVVVIEESFGIRVTEIIK